jgi:glycosyltransferase involved in cell wall biosynthesis
MPDLHVDVYDVRDVCTVWRVVPPQGRGRDWTMSHTQAHDGRNEPTVSIIVPCFNQAGFIRETLDSVAQQTYASWQCIVVDDGSTDDTEAVVQRHIAGDARFSYVRKANGGVAAARNLGISLSTGEFILPLDGDDKIHKQYVQRAIEYFIKHPATDLVYSKVMLFGAKQGIWRLPHFSYQKLLFENMIVNSAIFRRALFDRTTGYAEHMVHGFEDWEFYIRLLNADSVVHRFNAPLFLYRIKPQSRSTEQISGGHFDQSVRQIYESNPQAYGELMANPIAHFKSQRQLFRPDMVSRYKRQRVQLHCFYGAIIALMLTALVTRLSF